MTERRFDALLLDIGDVITAPIWDQLDELEAATGRQYVGRGPLDPDGDPLWQQFLRGDLTFYEYWGDYATAAGYADWRDLFRELTVHLPHRFGDPDAYALMAEARLAGYKIAVLTNDGVSIGGHEFFSTIPEFQVLDAFVDARQFGAAKPDPEPYLRAAEALDVPTQRIVFRDDMQPCIDGATNVGMTGVLVNPLDKRQAFEQVRAILGLSRSDYPADSPAVAE